MKAAVLGMGVVGRSQARMFARYPVVTYDIADTGAFPAEDVAACDFAIVAAGTPQAASGAADISQVHAAVRSLPPAMPVIIRSTVPPGTTDALAARRPGFTACAPEFLYEGGTGPWRESVEVPWLITGGSPEAAGFFRDVFAQVFPGEIHLTSAVAAELAKYTANAYWAARVTFVNELSAIVAAYGVPWEDVRAAWLMDERVNPAYTVMDGFPPGFAGRCWPKDLSALISAAWSRGYPAHFLRAVQEANREFRDDH